METKIIYDSSINQDLIKNLKVAVIGFGSQGSCSCIKSS
jgi:ketol-acid reductoisomerase